MKTKMLTLAAMLFISTSAFSDVDCETYGGQAEFGTSVVYTWQIEGDENTDPKKCCDPKSPVSDGHITVSSNGEIVYDQDSPSSTVQSAACNLTT